MEKIFEIIKGFHSKHIFISVFAWTISISVLFVLVCFWLTDLNIVSFRQTQIDRINSASIIILTLFIVWVAWIQLSHLRKISQSDFLIKIINHFSDKSIIQALEIVHRIRLESENENGQHSDKHTSFIAKRIREIRDDPNNINEYLLLKSFLDYLEHIAYLCNENYISIKDIENCIGERICDYYDYFRDLINYCKSTQIRNKDNAYKQLSILFDKLNTPK